MRAGVRKRRPPARSPLPRHRHLARGRGEDGVILVFWAISLSALVGCVALALGLGDVAQKATNLQDAADSAALAAATALGASPSCVDGPSCVGAAESAAEQVVATYGVGLGSCDAAPPTGKRWVPEAGGCLAFYFPHPEQARDPNDFLGSPTVVWVSTPPESATSILGGVLPPVSRSAVAYYDGGGDGTAAGARLCTLTPIGNGSGNDGNGNGPFPGNCGGAPGQSQG